MTAELPILYSFRRCPYAMRARMALIASGVAVELREVVLRAKPAEMIAASPKATVPVLVLPGGRVIDQSLDIMLWALAKNDPHNWLNCDWREIVATNDGAFKLHLDRYKYPERHGSDPTEHRAAGLAILAGLDTRLHLHANLCRDTPCLADIATMPFVRQFAAVDPPWFDALPLPRLQGWLACHIASRPFTAAMVRVERWHPGNAPISLGYPLAAGAIAP